MESIPTIKRIIRDLEQCKGADWEENRRLRALQWEAACEGAALESVKNNRSISADRFFKDSLR